MKIKIKNLNYHFILLLITLWLSTTLGAAPRIAVVGAGIGGASFTRFVLQEIPDARIVLFERSDSVGGRVTHSADHIELGASMVSINVCRFFWPSCICK